MPGRHMQTGAEEAQEALAELEKFGEIRHALRCTCPSMIVESLFYRAAYASKSIDAGW